MPRWSLPEYIEDILPPEAERLERVRRALLDHLHRHGYLLVQPPLLEHVESLTTGTGRDLELETFKVVDQLSGRLLGLRADITPQVARIDAHLLHEHGITRLCYCGSVTRTVPSGLHQTRELIQIGAELYGHPGIASDAEVLGMLLSGLSSLGIAPLHLDLGHVGVFRAIARAANLVAEREQAIHEALRAKDGVLLAELGGDLPEPWRNALRTLPSLYGDAAQVLGRARRELPDVPGIACALDDLEALVARTGGGAERLNVDLADLRGYHYHTGVLFAVLTPGEPNAIGLGGRYDDIGRAFGRARPATGFTVYLRQLGSLVADAASARPIVAPAGDDASLRQAVDGLRAAGEAVIVALDGEAGDAGAAVRRLVARDGRWVVVEN